MTDPDVISMAARGAGVFALGAILTAVSVVKSFSADSGRVGALWLASGAVFYFGTTFTVALIMSGLL